MTALILHHYDLSPFSEKARLALGHKGLDWHAVEMPIWPPKPDLVALTGGYRRAPVLQVGADLYCDTQLVLREIERRHPAPTLWPDGAAGLAQAVAWWADKVFFLPAARLTTSLIGDGLPAGFLEDRKDCMATDFGREASRAVLPLDRQRLHAHGLWLAEMLRDGRPFLLGAGVSVADLAAYHPLWFARRNGGAEAEALLPPLAPLEAWMGRVAALGHGRRRAMDPAAALDAARRAAPDAPVPPPDGDPSGLRAGQAVVVRADDTGREPVAGVLVGADAASVVVRREDPRAGMVHVHFPRAGFDVTPA